MGDRHELHIEGLELDARVLRFVGREAINEHFRFDLELSVPKQDALGLRERALARGATFTMRGGARERSVHGLVGRVQLVGAHDAHRAVIGVRLVPRAHVLTLRRASRTHQDLSASAILEQVFRRTGLPLELRLKRSLEVRSYASQYDETDQAFAARLAAEEGLFFWFEHTGGQDAACFADDATAYSRAERLDLDFRPLADGAAAVNGGVHLRRFARAEHLSFEAALHRSYDPLRPAAPLADARTPLRRGAALELHEQAALTETSRCWYGHSGAREQALLQPTSASLMLEAATADADLSEGESDCPSLAPGHVFSCREHPLPELDAEYTPTWVEHEGYDPATTPTDRPSYSNRFAAVPAGTPFRPARPARHVRQTLESATVVGPPGQEIHTDDLGRVKVRFHWDVAHDPTGEASSCWLRVAQGWGSGGFGAHFLPRVGSEVAVAYMDGDPDRPVVVGTLYNGAQTGPFSFPEDSTRSGIRTRSSPGGAGGHELVFEDREGSETVTLRSQRHMSVASVDRMDLAAGGAARIAAAMGLEQSSGGDFTKTVGRNAVTEVAGTEQTVIRADSRSRVHGERHVGISGSDTKQVGTDSTLMVGRTHRVVVSAPPDGPRATSLHATHGLHEIFGSEGLTLRSTEAIELRVGNTTVRLTEDALEIDTPALRVLSKEIDLDIDRGKSHLRLAGAFTVAAGNIVLGTGGASLALDSEAKLDGAMVKLNCGKAKAGGKLDRKAGPEGVAVFELVGDLALLTTGITITFAVRMPNGEIAEHPIDADGRLSLPGKEGDVFTLVAILADGIPTPALEVRT